MHRGRYNRHSYIYDEKIIDARKVEEAAIQHALEGERVRVHYHDEALTCVDRCHDVLPEEVKDAK